MPVCLATRVSCAAHSRTCATEPGADVSCSEYSVWIESITATAGCVRPIVREDFFERDLRPADRTLRGVDSPAAGRAKRSARRTPRR